MPTDLPLLDPALLAAERARLVAFCTRFTGGDRETAEDLAQETLLEAWRNQSNLRDPAAWRGWLSGIARHVCLRWARRHGGEQKRRAQAGSGSGIDGGESGLYSGGMDTWVEETIAAPNTADFTDALEQAEMAHLLDRALSRLAPGTRDLLVERYVDELPQAEMAARRGIREETVAVQLHRGRSALRRALTTTDELRGEAKALGLITSEEDVWQETRIWCANCGQRKLEGRFGPYPSGQTEFRLRCPLCNADGGDVPFTDFRAGGPHITEVLAGVKGFKPALSRLVGWWRGYYRSGLEKGVAPCLRCGRPAPVRLTPPGDLSEAVSRMRGVFIDCASCGTLFGAGLEMVGLWQPETQKFWRDNPRIRAVPSREVPTSGGGKALVTRFESVTGNAALEIVSTADTLDVIEVVSS